MGLRLLFLRFFMALTSCFDFLASCFLLLAFNRRPLRHVAAEIACEFAPVVCIDLRIILPAGDRYISETAVHQLLAFIRVHVDEHTLGRLSLAAVARDSVTVVEMGMLVHVEPNFAA